MIAFEGTLWRILFADQSDVLAPSRAPEVRFHHSGQPALYASLGPEGAGIAIQRYIGAKDPFRVIHPLTARLTRLVDLRNYPDPAAVSIVWQHIRAQGQPSPTWSFSDAARADGAEGVLYPSRSRPDLTHIALFEWDAGRLFQSGLPCAWP